MKKIELLWSGDWIDPESIPLIRNRSFLYGDGFFESIRWSSSRSCHLWDFHWARIQKTINALQFPWPDQWENQSFQQFILALIPQSIKSDMRVKIVFFRSGEGRYAPSGARLCLHFEIEPVYLPWIQKIDKIGKAETVTVSKSQFSFVKSTSALTYVMAGIEKTNRALADLVICHPDGYVVEGSFSSIFWFDGKKINIPDESLGGLDSCMRRFLIQFWNEKGIGFSESKSTWENVKEAQWIGFGSGLGIRFWLNHGVEMPIQILPQIFLKG